MIKMKWEYTVVYLANFELSDIDALNEFGKMGWEMVTVDNGMVYFKRMIGVELSQEITSDGAIKEMAEIMEKAVANLALRGK